MNEPDALLTFFRQLQAAWKEDEQALTWLRASCAAATGSFTDDEVCRLGLAVYAILADREKMLE